MTTTSKKHRSRLHRFTRLALALTVIASGAALFVLSYAAKKMVSPPRSPLRIDHREWMANPQEHGLRIVSTHCLDGKIPCLLVEPVAGAGHGSVLTTPMPLYATMAHWFLDCMASAGITGNR